MLKANRLKGKIISNDMTITSFSKMVGMDSSTFYRKMTHNSFTVEEVDRIIEALHLSLDEAVEIFFAQKGA